MRVKPKKSIFTIALMCTLILSLFTTTVFAGGYVDPSSPPPSSVGYKAPKSGAQKAKVPGSNERGWVDKDGKYWIPDNNMDGGPGWVRQYPDKSHDHVYPNGSVRKHPKQGGQAAKYSISWWKVAALGLLTVVAILTPIPGDELIVGGALLGI